MNLFIFWNSYRKKRNMFGDKLITLECFVRIYVKVYETNSNYFYAFWPNSHQWKHSSYLHLYNENTHDLRSDLNEYLYLPFKFFYSTIWSKNTMYIYHLNCISFFTVVLFLVLFKDIHRISIQTFCVLCGVTPTSRPHSG